MKESIIKKYRLPIVATIAALLIVIVSVILLSAPNIDTGGPTEPDDSSSTTTDSPSRMDYGKITDSTLIPPIVSNSDPSNTEAWKEYEKNIEKVAMDVILEYYAGHSVRDQWLIWSSSRSQIANSDYPEFRFTAYIDGRNVSVSFKLTSSDGKIVLMPGSVREITSLGDD